MNVLVTGGGFLGSALARRLLARGDGVRVFGRRARPALRAEGVEVLCGDVADPAHVAAAVAGCEAVFHTAAQVGSWGRPALFERTNVEGTRNVIAACLQHGVRRLVFTSSPSVAHGRGDCEGIDESHGYAEAFDAEYPRTKAIAERLVLAANGRALATLALRPHLMWGPGDTQLIPRVVARARAGTLRLPGGPAKRVDCTYVDNAVDAHLAALARLAPGAVCAGRAYFISQGEPLPQRDLITQVLEAVGIPGPFPTVAPWILRRAGAAAEAWWRVRGIWDREPPLTRFVARQLTSAHWFDISAARRDLGYEPRVSIATGLARLRRDAFGS